MVWMYLEHPDGTYSNGQDYPEPPNPRPDGAWKPGKPPEGMLPYVQRSLALQLNDLFLQLPQADQIQFLPYLGAIAAIINTGGLTEAKAFLSAIQCPPDAQAIQTQMLALFP